MQKDASLKGRHRGQASSVSGVVHRETRFSNGSGLSGRHLILAVRAMLRLMVSASPARVKTKRVGQRLVHDEQGLEERVQDGGT